MVYFAFWGGMVYVPLTGVLLGWLIAQGISYFIIPGT